MNEEEGRCVKRERKRMMKRQSLLFDGSVIKSYRSRRKRNKMNIWFDKNSSANDHKTNRPIFDLIKQWKSKSPSQGPIVATNSSREDAVMHVSDIPFIIPRQIEDVRNRSRPNFERSKLTILRMDEYFQSSKEKIQAKQRRWQDTSLGLRALAEVANTIQKIAFREVLSIDETLPNMGRNLFDLDDDNQPSSSMDRLFQQINKFDPITDFHQIEDFIEFDHELAKHRMEIIYRPTNRPSDMIYLKFCLILEIQRDEYESCLRILLHDIIFKYHLAEFRLRCEIHVRKPIEHELVLERLVHDSHLKENYSAEFILWSGDWIAQQEVELYIVLKIESLSINKYITSKFLDMAHLHVKSIPHGASKIFLRELTPVCRPHKILPRGILVGQVEIEVGYWSERHELSVHILKVTHSHIERLLRTPETYVEIIFQSPFDIYDIKRTRITDRSSVPKIDEEFYFEIPDRLSVRDITVDLIFLEKSSLHHHPVVLGALILSRHTDWYPVRKFWKDVEENPNMKFKDRFSFEGNIYD